MSKDFKDVICQPRAYPGNEYLKQRKELEQ